MVDTAAIELRNITKTFGKVVANRDVSLTVNRGEILSVLGENGSGKTTLMKMAVGLIKPTSGDFYYKDEKIGVHSRKEIAYREKPE